MIDIQNLTYTYPNTFKPALDNFSLQIPEQAFVLVSGISGSGKSTLLRALNGLVPHFYGGKYSGRVIVNGVDTVSASPRSLASTVGFVFQDPTHQFVVQKVEDEIAFGLENLAVDPATMPTRITEALATVRAEHLRHRHIQTLSGGEAQRVAIASVLVMRPKILVLDEPTSQLDPPSATILLDLLVRLHREHGITIVLAEHRLTRILSVATHLLVMKGDSRHLFGEPANLIVQSDLKPPFMEAALHFGWHPLPMSIREAKSYPAIQPIQPIEWSHVPSQPILTIENLSIGYHTKPVIENLNLALHQNECLAVLGANGVGKSTLLKTLAGMLKPITGNIYYNSIAITHQRIDQRAQLFAYVPQDPNSILFQETLLDELMFTLKGLKLAVMLEPLEFLEVLQLADYAKSYPRDLSGGERQRAALAAMVIAKRPILLLDEPTMGLDYRQREILVSLLKSWVYAGHSIILATHDLELAARVAHRVMILENGHFIEGTPREILLKTPGYQTELAQIFGRNDLITTDDLSFFEAASASQMPTHRLDE